MMQGETHRVKLSKQRRIDKKAHQIRIQFIQIDYVTCAMDMISRD